MKNALAALLLSFALGATLLAQDAPAFTPGPQNHVAFLTKKLGLTAPQQSQATAIFTNNRAAESTLHASMKTARQSLNDAVKSNNTVSIEQLSTTIGNLTAQLTLAQSKSRAAFYQILTPEQRSTLDQLESQHGSGSQGPRAASRANGQ
jgi:Spy/CpxP family protein refolding chaperone